MQEQLAEILSAISLLSDRIGQMDQRIGQMDQRLGRVELITRGLAKNLLPDAQCRALGIEPETFGPSSSGASPGVPMVAKPND